MYNTCVVESYSHLKGKMMFNEFHDEVSREELYGIYGEHNQLSDDERHQFTSLLSSESSSSR